MSAASLITPHALAKRMERCREFRRLGLPSGRAASLAFSVRGWSGYLEARLDLLPDHFAASVSTIVDVGANHGDWSSAVLQVLRPAKLIALEPNPALFPDLSKRLKQHPGVTCLNIAASSAPGKLPFHITTGSQCASLLKPNQEMTGIYGSDFAEAREILVAVDTLDSLLAAEKEISLLKIDVQGYEREVLQGAKATLAKTRHVLIEANFVSHYENDIQFPELHTLMAMNGFVLANLSKPFIKQGKAMWADALFTRS